MKTQNLTPGVSLNIYIELSLVFCLLWMTFHKVPQRGGVVMTGGPVTGVTGEVSEAVISEKPLAVIEKERGWYRN